MANTYEKLRPKLLEAFKGEWDGLDGTKPRQFFSDRMGSGSYEALFEDFMATPHDSNWSKWSSGAGTFTEIATEARAAGHMDSMWRDLHQLYLVDEINSLDEERNAAGKWLMQDPGILLFNRQEGW